MISPPRTLYYYCSTETFVSIIQNNSIRLSSLTQSNDALEGRLISQTIAKLAISDGLAFDLRIKLLAQIENYEGFFDALGMCFSSKHDLLSQWRGYADNGGGMCIGFNFDYLKNLAKTNAYTLNLHQVEYSDDKQTEALAPSYNGLKKHIDNGALDSWKGGGLLDLRTEENRQLQSVLQNKKLAELNNQFYDFTDHLFTFKSSAFAEEHEWRLYTTTAPSLPPSEYNKYRVRDGHIVPYREIKIGNSAFEKKAIDSVTLGPKQKTPAPVVADFLKHAGVAPKIELSKLTYR